MRNAASQTKRTAPRALMEVLGLAAGYLKEWGVPNPRLDAEVLLAHVLQVDRIRLYVEHDRPLEPAELDAYRKAVARRARREPVAYITGEKEFYGLTLAVDKRTLIPRPETEILVEQVVKASGRARQGALELVDVGTGSGAVAIAVCKAAPAARAAAVDVSKPALEVAQANARRHGVAERIEFLHGDLLEPVQGRTFDGIAANLPYVPDGELAGLEPELAHEPREALAGGRDGLQLIRRLLAAALRHLKPGGFVALEIGSAQGAEVLAMGREAGLGEGTVHNDLAGLPRVVVWEAPDSP